MKRLLYTLGMAVSTALAMTGCQSLTDPNDFCYAPNGNDDSTATEYVMRPTMISLSGDEGKGQRTKTTKFYYDREGKLTKSVFTYHRAYAPDNDEVDTVNYTWEGQTITNSDAVQHAVSRDGLVTMTQTDDGSSYNYSYNHVNDASYLRETTRHDGSQTYAIKYEWKDDYMSALKIVKIDSNDKYYYYDYSDGFQATDGWSPMWMRYIEEVAEEDELCMIYPEMFGLLTKRLPNTEECEETSETSNYIESIGQTQNIRTVTNTKTTYIYEFGTDGCIAGGNVETTVTVTNDYNFYDINGDGIITSNEYNYRNTYEAVYTDRYTVTWEKMPKLVWTR